MGNRKALTTKQKERIVAAHNDGWTIHQLCERYGKSFYTIKDLVSDNDNAQKIATANKALVKASKPDLLTQALQQVHKDLHEAMPNARRVVIDMETGEAAVELITTLRMKVRP